MLTSLGSQPDANLAPLPLTPYVPKFMVRRLERMVLKVPEARSAVPASEELPAATETGRTAPTPAICRSVWSRPGIAEAELENLGGLLCSASGRVHGRIFLTVSAWTVGATPAKLRRGAVRARRRFGLCATFD